MPFEITQVPASAGRPRYHQYSDDTIRELIEALENLADGQGIKLGEYTEEAVARGQARAAQRQLANYNVTVGTSVWEIEDNDVSRYVSAIHPSVRTDSRDEMGARFKQAAISKMDAEAGEKETKGGKAQESPSEVQEPTTATLPRIDTEETAGGTS